MQSPRVLKSTHKKRKYQTQIDTMEFAEFSPQILDREFRWAFVSRVTSFLEPPTNG
jgi:hypothetical protein